MAHYVDGFVLPIATDKVEEYRKIARRAGRIWREHGALEFRECIGDDLSPEHGVPFTRLIKAKPRETVVFSWILFKSRAHRDRVNAKVMKDRRMMSTDPAGMPIDPRRMAYGGFKVLVDG